jgi:hypothetical protein
MRTARITASGHHVRALAGIRGLLLAGIHVRRLEVSTIFNGVSSPKPPQSPQQ